MTLWVNTTSVTSPRRIILEFKEAIDDYQTVIDSLPSFFLPLEKILTLLFERLQNKQNSINDIGYLSGLLSFDNEDANVHDTLELLNQARREQALYNLGIEIFTYLDKINVYDNSGKFQYRFEQLLLDGSIVLVRAI